MSSSSSSERRSPAASMKRRPARLRLVQSAAAATAAALALSITGGGSGTAVVGVASASVVTNSPAEHDEQDIGGSDSSGSGSSSRLDGIQYPRGHPPLSMSTSSLAEALADYAVVVDDYDRESEEGEAGDDHESDPSDDADEDEDKDQEDDYYEIPLPECDPSLTAQVCPTIRNDDLPCAGLAAVTAHCRRVLGLSPTFAVVTSSPTTEDNLDDPTGNMSAALEGCISYVTWDDSDDDDDADDDSVVVGLACCPSTACYEAEAPALLSDELLSNDEDDDDEEGEEGGEDDQDQLAADAMNGRTPTTEDDPRVPHHWEYALFSPDEPTPDIHEPYVGEDDPNPDVPTHLYEFEHVTDSKEMAHMATILSLSLEELEGLYARISQEYGDGTLYSDFDHEDKDEDEPQSWLDDNEELQQRHHNQQQQVPPEHEQPQDNDDRLVNETHDSDETEDGKNFSADDVVDILRKDDPKKPAFVAGKPTAANAGRADQ